MKIRDNKRTAEIEMYIWKSGQGRVRPDWSVDFFEAGNLPDDEETDTFTVQDVDYCIAQARDWENEECEETGAENRVIVKIPSLNLVEFSGEENKRPENLFNAVADCPNPIVHETMEDTPENRQKAQKWLAGKKNTCSKMRGTVGSYYLITAYAIEYFMADEEGEWIAGSDYDPAEDEEEEA